jgi:hypothetical protein
LRRRAYHPSSRGVADVTQYVFPVPGLYFRSNRHSHRHASFLAIHMKTNPIPPSRRIAFVALIVTLLFILTSPMKAQRVYCFGHIGNERVAAWFDQEHDTLSGWYFRVSQPREVRVEGDMTRDGTVRLAESFDPRAKGMFTGKSAQGVWTGTWKRDSGSAELPFRFDEYHDPLSTLTCSYRCAYRRVDGEMGYVYRWNLVLSVAAGRVRALSIVESARNLQGEEHQCSISLDALRQVPSADGILLRLAEDDAPDDSIPSCGVRILATKDLLWLRFEDTPGAASDCRGTNSTMYCAPRAFWTDIIVDRKTGKCKAIE